MCIQNHTKTVKSKDSLIMDILCSEFGYYTVNKAINYIDSYNRFKQDNFKIIVEHFNRLSYEWQLGNARNYLESLATELQYYIICHLMDDYYSDKNKL